MEHSFRAFTFVDRIVSVQPGVRIRGSYTVPAGLDAFPFSLVAESLGQCIAWAAMAPFEFKFRPVAGIAGGIDLLKTVQPGQELELAGEIESVDDQAVAYNGVASVGGVPVLRLHHCVGPMVSMEEFDDPQQVRDRFNILCGAGRTVGGFGGVGSVSLGHLGGETGASVCATLAVPVSADFFADHFPRRPVFPGSLLMHQNLGLAARLATEITPPAKGSQWTLRTIRDMKLRAFMAPGELLNIEARLQDRSDETLGMTVETRRGKKTVGGARVLFGSEERS